jgi:hypothetical protein
MTIEINYTDKFLAGVYHSFTITSDEGFPSGSVHVGDTEIPSRIVHMQDPKYKISFKIPPDTEGKELVVKISAGATTVEEKQEITAA